MKDSREIAVTGGIASGKTSVCQILADEGYKIVDTDILTKEVTACGGRCYNSIVDMFGKDVVLSDGSLDRACIRQLILKDAALKKRLEEIIHPVVLECVKDSISTLRSNGYTAPVFIEVPLLFEAGWDAFFPEILLVTAPVDARIRRLMTYRGLSEEEAGLLIKSQMDEQEKIRKATWVIHNPGDKTTLRKKVLEFISQLSESE